MRPKLEIPKSYTQVILAMLIFNLLHILAWELPLALKYNWEINIYGAAVVLTISALSILLICFRRKLGIVLGLMQASWAIFFQWFLIYFVTGHTEPHGVWWYPIFTIFQGIQIIYFSVLILGKINKYADSTEAEIGLRAPSIYLQAIFALLLTQVGQKIVREAVVGYSEGQTRALFTVGLLIVIAIASAVFTVKRKKWALWTAMLYGDLLIIQPIVYHLILGRPCYGGIWWYPFFTATQGGFIVYFALIVFRQERMQSTRRLGMSVHLER